MFITDTAIKYSVDRIDSAKLVKDPFPHYVITNFLYRPLFEQIAMNWPAKHEMGQPRWYSREIDIVPDPCIEEVNEGRFHYKNLLESRKWHVWEKVEDCLFNKQLARILLHKVGDPHYRMDDFYACGRLMTDLSGSGIGPHTDRLDKLVSMVIYINGTGASGTQLLKPKDPKKKFDMSRHYTWDEFEVVKEIEFIPNQAILWGVHEKSFHAFSQNRFCDRRNIKYFVQKVIDPNIVIEERHKNKQFARDWKKS